MKWVRICPKCGKEVYYKNKSTLRAVEWQGGNCRNCTKGSKYTEEDLSRKCPICNRTITHTRALSCKYAEGKPCGSCARKNRTFIFKKIEKNCSVCGQKWLVAENQIQKWESGRRECKLCRDKRLQSEYKIRHPTSKFCKYIVRRLLIERNEEKIKHAVDYLGYSALELQQHLEKLFLPTMSWENYGSEWHIDHIKPICAFTKETPISEINALANLRPMWRTTRIINGIEYKGNLNKNKYE